MIRLPAFFLAFFSLALLFQRVEANTFHFDENCKEAYRSIFKLKFQEGKDKLMEVRQSNPDNLMPVFLENYVDFLALFISDDEALFKRLSGNKDKRMASMQSGDAGSPWYLYTQASLNLQWAFTRMKFGEYFAAIFEIRKAHQLLKENKEKFPDFKPNDKDLSLLNAMFGAVPDKYKGGAKLMGMKGDIDEGLKEMARLIKDPNMLFREESLIMYTMMLLHLGKDKDGAWDLINGLDIPLRDNLLNHFIVSTVSLYTGQNDKIIQVLSNRPKSKEFYPFPFLDYMMGIAKLNRLDKDADIYLNAFIRNYQGKNYLREAYRKLAWHYLINRQPEKYHSTMAKLLTVGNESLDSDKAASLEARSKKEPDKDLLKARLLSDGGYYQQALKALEAVNQSSMSTEEQVEFLYRKARIYDQMGQFAQASPLYLQVIKKGEKLPLYFAANACIRMGYNYEEKGDKVKAAEYYRRAMSFQKHEYKNSIEAEAKAGLNRISAQ